MTAPLPLHTHGRVEGVIQPEILKVMTLDEARSSHLSSADVLIWRHDGDHIQMRRSGAEPITLRELKDPRVVQPGDVVRLRPGASLISVLYRRGSSSNTLFATERCNSLCLMCSQPPRDEDDSWRVGEMLRVVSLVDRHEQQLGVTGGEPTLLGDGLAEVLNACRRYLPDTLVPVLTNGRLFRDRPLAERLQAAHPNQVSWAIPLYSDVAEIHDEVVAATGAFDETLEGLFELGRLGARIEVRVVLHRMTVPRLPQLAAFIYRRLPFVRHVALMGLEPMGFARTNRERLWVDPADYIAELQDAAFHLLNRGMQASIYNLPLCVLPRSLWPYARQSISGWKNLFPAECEGCAVREHCSGFFTSAGPAWRSRVVRPLDLAELVQ